MASNRKEVKVKVATEEELSGVEALELRVEKLRKQRIQLRIDATTEKLNEANSRIDEIKRTIAGLEAVPAHLGIDIDESEITKLKSELAQLEQKSLDLELSVETDELQKAKSEVEELDNTEIDLQLSVQNFSQGISQTKQGISELKQNMDEVAQAGMQSEQNKAFLELNEAKLNGKDAVQVYEDISKIVKDMPGDDNTMRSVLSTAQALGNNLSTEEMKAAATTMSDYMSGSATMGKQALESQQDIMKYLLDGNTAELERGSIVSSQVDKLKDATTFQERQAAMQEVLNELGYGGIGNMDTMLNKQAEWDGMIFNSQDALSSMWLGAEKGAMDYILTLDEASNGLVGMGIVAGQMVTGPFVEIMGGIAQIGMGFQNLKKLADFSGITTKLGALKTALMNVGTKAKEAALWMVDLGKKALLAGYNALKAAGLWLVEKAALVAHKIATWASAAAQWALNVAMDANPIMLVVLAIIALVAILGYLYFNNEQVRAAIDGLGQTFMWVGQIMYTSIINAINWIIGALQNFYNYVMTLGGLLPENVNITGNQIIDSILAFLIFFATLPIQVGVILINTIAKVLGFGDNFVQNMIRAGSRSVSNFINYISSLPGKLSTELNNMLSAVGQWAATLPQKFWDAGVNAVKNFLSALGIASPGTMQRMLVWEITEMGNRIPDESKGLLANVSSLGSNIVDEFGDPTLGLNYEDTMNAQLASAANNNTANGNTYNFYHYGDMDNEDRMNKFVDAVIKRLAFENETAGRTV